MEPCCKSLMSPLWVANKGSIYIPIWGPCGSYTFLLAGFRPNSDPPRAAYSPIKNVENKGVCFRTVSSRNCRREINIIRLKCSLYRRIYLPCLPVSI